MLLSVALVTVTGTEADTLPTVAVAVPKPAASPSRRPAVVGENARSLPVTVQVTVPVRSWLDPSE
jgi:hypothetical protein